MNTTIVYHVCDARGIVEQSCTSLCQALAVRQRLKNPDAAMILPVLDEPITTVFHNIDELIADLVRNHARKYSVTEWSDDWSGDGPYENEPFMVSLLDLLTWLVSHADRYELFTYVFDPDTRHGSYRLTNGIGAAEAAGLRVDEILL